MIALSGAILRLDFFLKFLGECFQFPQNWLICHLQQCFGTAMYALQFLVKPHDLLVQHQKHRSLQGGVVVDLFLLFHQDVQCLPQNAKNALVSQISNPDGGQTSYTYSTGSSTPWSITTSQKIDGSPRYLTTMATYDGLGRATKQQLTSDPDATGSNSIDTTDTTYDSMGRIYSVSNPYGTTSDQTYGITYYSYDALNRITQIKRPDQTAVLTLRAAVI